MLIGIHVFYTLGQNKRATSLKFIPPQISCGVLSIYPLCLIQPRQYRFLYCSLWAHVKYFSKNATCMCTWPTSSGLNLISYFTSWTIREGYKVLIKLFTLYQLTFNHLNHTRSTMKTVLLTCINFSHTLWHVLYKLLHCMIHI